MNLDTIVAIAQIISFAFVAPAALFRIWRKLDVRLTDQDKRLERIEYQVYENGGKSMKDQINNLVVDVAVLKARANEHSN